MQSVTENAQLSSRTDKARRWLIGGTALVLLDVYLVRSPVSIPLPGPEDLVAPDVAKLWLALRTLLAFAALNAAAAGAGLRLAGRLGVGTRIGLAAPCALMLGLLALAYCVLLLASVHAISSQTLVVLLLIFAGWGGRPLLRALRDAANAARRVRKGPAIAAALVLAGPLLRAFGPDPGWDALTYHLALPERYLFENGIVVTPFSVFSTFPGSVEMLFAFAVAFDVPPLASLLHLELGVLTAWVVFALAARVSRRAGWLALAVLAADPLFLGELGLAYNDLAACLTVLLAVACLHEGLAGGRLGAFAASGVFAGAAASVRYTTWGLVPALVLLTWLPPTQGSPRRALLASLALGTSALAVLAPWLVRNLVFAGNPVAPALEGWFHPPGSEYFHPVALRQAATFLQTIGPGTGLGDLLALPWSLTFEATPGDYGGFGFQIGGLYLIGAVVALAVGRAGRPPLSSLLLRLSLLLTLFWFYAAQEPRYLLPALALVAVAGGIAADALIPRAGNGRLWLALPLLAVLHAQLPSLVGVPRDYAWALGPRGARAEERQPAEVVGEQLRERLGEHDRLLLVFEPRSFYFRGLDYVPYHTPEGPQLLQAIHDAVAQDDLAGLFARLGANHVLVNRNVLERFSPMEVSGYSRDDFRADVDALRRFLQAHTTPVLEERGIMVRRLRDPAAGGPRGARP